MKIKIPKDFFKKLKFKIDVKPLYDFVNKEHRAYMEEEVFFIAFFLKYPKLKKREEELRENYKLLKFT